MVGWWRWSSPEWLGHSGPPPSNDYPTSPKDATPSTSPKASRTSPLHPTSKPLPFLPSLPISINTGFHLLLWRWVLRLSCVFLFGIGFAAFLHHLLLTCKACARCLRLVIEISEGETRVGRESAHGRCYLLWPVRGICCVDTSKFVFQFCVFFFYYFFFLSLCCGVSFLPIFSYGLYIIYFCLVPVTFLFGIKQLLIPVMKFCCLILLMKPTKHALLWLVGFRYATNQIVTF